MDESKRSEQVPQKKSFQAMCTEKFATGRVVILWSLLDEAKPPKSSSAYSSLIRQNGSESKEWRPGRKRWKVSDNLYIYQIASLSDLTQSMRKAAEDIGRIDVIIIDGHGMDNYLILTGEMQQQKYNDVQTKSLCSESIFGLTLNNDDVFDEINQDSKLTPTGKLLAGAAASIKSKNNSPILVLGGCNISYNIPGKNFVKLLSNHVFNKFLVMSTNDYLIVNYNFKTNSLCWLNGAGRDFDLRSAYFAYGGKSSVTMKNQDTDQPITLKIDLSKKIQSTFDSTAKAMSELSHPVHELNLQLNENIQSILTDDNYIVKAWEFVDKGIEDREENHLDKALKDFEMALVTLNTNVHVPQPDILAKLKDEFMRIANLAVSKDHLQLACTANLYAGLTCINLKMIDEAKECLISSLKLLHPSRPLYLGDTILLSQCLANFGHNNVDMLKNAEKVLAISLQMTLGSNGNVVEKQKCLDLLISEFNRLAEKFSANGDSDGAKSCFQTCEKMKDFKNQLTEKFSSQDLLQDQDHKNLPK